MKWILVFVCFFAGAFQAKSPNWELKKSGPGILVYTAENEFSPIKDVKATLDLNGSLSSVVSVVRDLSSYPKWIYNCSEGKVIKMLGDTELFFYQRIDAPWPVSDRDLCSHYKIRQNPQTLELSVISQAEPNLLPEIDGVVRVKKSKTLWKIKPIGKGVLKGEYYLSFDPAGDVPVWLINLFITEGPYGSLLKLKKLITETPHKEAKFHFIKEIGI